MNHLQKYLMAVCLLVAWMPISSLTAQEAGVSYKLGKGLRMNVQGGLYQFKLSGFFQPFYTNTLAIGDNKDNRSHETGHNFIVDRARINLAGRMKKEKIRFFVDFDFTESSPLYEAWVAYLPFPFLNVSFGQKLSFLHNRTHYASEEKLQFAQRNPLSENFTAGSGREFGLFLESHFSVLDIILRPSIALTSGDGRNSFGVDSTDVDRGGLKYGARLDILPLGKFKNKGDYHAADTAREESPKLALGGAFSFNNGASGVKGDGHSQNVFYDLSGDAYLPNYQKISGSLLVKWMGFSLLGEYANTFVLNPVDLYLYNEDTKVFQPFIGEAISDHYVIGQAFNIQMGYIFLFGLGIYAGYALMLPEFPDYTSPKIKLRKETWYTAGSTWYFESSGMLKVNLTASYVKDSSADAVSNDRLIIRVLTQAGF